MKRLKILRGSCILYYWHLCFVLVCVCVSLVGEKSSKQLVRWQPFKPSFHLIYYSDSHGAMDRFWVLMMSCVYDLGHIGLLHHDSALKPSAFSPSQYSHASLYPPVISAKLSHHSRLFFFFPFRLAPIKCNFSNQLISPIVKLKASPKGEC